MQHSGATPSPVLAHLAQILLCKKVDGQNKPMFYTSVQYPSAFPRKSERRKRKKRRMLSRSMYPSAVSPLPHTGYWRWLYISGIHPLGPATCYHHFGPHPRGRQVREGPCLPGSPCFLSLSVSPSLVLPTPWPAFGPSNFPRCRARRFRFH